MKLNTCATDTRVRFGLKSPGVVTNTKNVGEATRPDSYKSKSLPTSLGVECSGTSTTIVEERDGCKLTENSPGMVDRASRDAFRLGPGASVKKFESRHKTFEDLVLPFDT